MTHPCTPKVRGPFSTGKFTRDLTAAVIIPESKEAVLSLLINMNLARAQAEHLMLSTCWLIPVSYFTIGGHSRCLCTSLAFLSVPAPALNPTVARDASGSPAPPLLFSVLLSPLHVLHGGDGRAVSSAWTEVLLILAAKQNQFSL